MQGQYSKSAARRMARREPIWEARPLAGLARAALHTSSTVAQGRAGTQRAQSTGMRIVGMDHLIRASAHGCSAQRRRASGHMRTLGSRLKLPFIQIMMDLRTPRPGPAQRQQEAPARVGFTTPGRCVRPMHRTHRRNQAAPRPTPRSLACPPPPGRPRDWPARLRRSPPA